MILLIATITTIVLTHFPLKALLHLPAGQENDINDNAARITDPVPDNPQKNFCENR